MRPLTVIALWLCPVSPVLAAQEERDAAIDPIEAKTEALDLIEAGEPDEAAQLLQSVARQDPTDAEARRLLGHALLSAGRASAARAAFVDALGLGRVTPGMLGALARIDLAAGRRAAADASLARLTWLSPGDVPSSLLRAQNLSDLGRAAAARAAVDAAILVAPADARVRRLSAALALERGEDLAAARSLELAWWLGDRDSDLAASLAGLAVRRGWSSRARAWLARAEAARLRAGTAAADQGDAGGRSGDGPTGGRTAPHAELWRGVARLELESGRPGVAVELLEGPARGLEEPAEHEQLLGLALSAAGRTEEAIDAWCRAVEAGCDERSVLAHLLSVGLERGDEALVALALEPLRRTVAPDDAEATRLLVLADLRRGRPESARSALLRHVGAVGMTRSARDLVALLRSETAGDGPGGD